MGSKRSTFRIHPCGASSFCLGFANKVSKGRLQISPFKGQRAFFLSTLQKKIIESLTIRGYVPVCFCLSLNKTKYFRLWQYDSLNALLLSECSLIACFMLSECSVSSWSHPAQKIKIVSSRTLWTEQTERQMNICISWALIGAKNTKYETTALCFVVLMILTFFWSQFHGRCAWWTVGYH